MSPSFNSSATNSTVPAPVGRPPDAGRPPGLLERTEVARPVPQPPGLAERTQVARPMPQVTAPPGVPMPGAATKTMPLWPAAPNAAAAQAPRVSLSPPKQVSQLDVTPLPAKEAFVAKAAAPALEPVPPPQTTAPAPPPRAFVVPPSFMNLPPAMEKPRRLGPDLATTQPGIPGPYSKPRAPFEVQDLPSTLDERAPVHGAATTSDEAVAAEQVLASPASLWRRLLASIVDLAVISLAVGGLLSVAVSIAGKPPPASLAGLDALVYGLRPIAVPALVLSALLTMLYTTLGAFLLEGRTLGRLLLGIRLVDSTGKAPGPVRSLLRALFAIVSFALFLAGFWLGLFDGKGQTLHDKLTRTFVIRPV